MPHRTSADRPAIVIVGSGPAGCAAALAVASRGIRPQILERGHPFQDKICGDQLGPASLEYLAMLGIGRDSLGALGGRPFDDLLTVQRRFGVSSAWAPAGPLFTLRRAVLDQALRDRCAPLADLQYEATVVGIEFDGNAPAEVLVRRPGGPLRVPADAVVLAHGARCALSRRLGLDGDADLVVGLRAYARAGTLRSPFVRHHEGLEPGYSWAFPLRDGTLNTGVWSPVGRHPRPLNDLLDLDAADLGIGERGRIRGTAGRTWSGRGRIWHHEAGVVSAGDAAGTMHPLTGEGVAAALATGMRAGLAAAAFVTAGREHAHLEAYTHWIGRRLARRLAS